MPSSGVVQALEALVPSIPALGKPFPPTLVSQSQSLLALSRQRHPHLKAEEEIARAHVCAEITCNRLRAQLRLPAIKNGAGAPCKPVVYRKLYKFLDASLADSVNGSLTPKGSKRALDGSVKHSGGSTRKTPIQRQADDTPSKKRTVDRKVPGLEFAGSIKGKGKSKAATSNDAGNDDDQSPNFVMPALRKLCKAHSTPSAVPHVYTGICIILGLADLWPTLEDDYYDEENDIDKAKRNEVLSLLVAVYLMVLTRMRKGKMTPEVYSQVSSKSLKALELGQTELTAVEEWINKVNSEGWCKDQDWWHSVPEDVIVLGSETNDLGEDEIDEFDGVGISNSASARQNWYRTILKNADAEESVPGGALLPGLGTMLHPGNDWTSEEKQLDFQEWKKDVLRKLDIMRRAEERK